MDDVRDTGYIDEAHVANQQARGHGVVDEPDRIFRVFGRCLSTPRLDNMPAQNPFTHSLTHSLITHLTHQVLSSHIMGFRPSRCTLVGSDANERHVPWTSPASRSHEMSHTHIGFRVILDPPSTARRVGWCAAASPASCRRLHDAAQAHGSLRGATPSQNGSRMAQARPAADPGRRSADTRGRRPR